MPDGVSMGGAIGSTVSRPISVGVGVGSTVFVAVGVAVTVSVGGGVGVEVSKTRGVLVGRAVTVGGPISGVKVGNGVTVAKGVRVLVGVLVGRGVPTVGVLVGVRVEVGVRVLVGVLVGGTTLVVPADGSVSPTFTIGPRVERGVGVGSFSLPPESVGPKSHPARNQNVITATTPMKPKAVRPGARRERD